MQARLLPLALWLVAIIPGFFSVVICTYYILIDWSSLRFWFAQWQKLGHSGADMRAITIAETYQNVFRTNVFAEGIWILLGSILYAIGVLGLCVLKRDGRAYET